MGPNMSTDYDVIVVGGGPAGLSAAKASADEGEDVLVLELQAQIGHTKTSIWVPDGVLDEEFSAARAESVNKINLHSVHENLEIEGNFGGIWRRGELDKMLASKAVSSGADIFVGSPVRSLLVEEKMVSGVKCKVGDWSEEIRGKVVIDASGSGGEWSNFFRRNILNLDSEDKDIVRTNEYLMADSSGKKELDLYFNSFLAPGGYAWIYPLSDRLSMAGIRGKRIHPDSALDEFIGSENPSRLEGSVPIGEYRGSVPADYEIRRSVSDGIIAVGSSAGQIYPLSGHGIQYAIESGKLAGKIASRSSRPHASEEELSVYDRKWKERFSHDIDLGRKIREALEISPDKRMDAIFEYLKSEPEVLDDFVNIFLGVDLENTVPRLFDINDIVEIFGSKTADRIRSSFE